MTSPEMWNDLIGLTVVDAAGDKVGKVGQIYLNEATGRPEWVTVTTGMFGTRESFAPLYGGIVRGDRLVLAVPKDLVKDAPNVDNDGRLEDAETARLYQHYADHLGSGPDLEQPGGETYDGRHAEAGPAGAHGRDTSGPTTDEAMTRSEERLRVGTENAETGRARLRKYVVTENVTTTVPVSHEEVRVEREPITEANRDAALSGPGISEEEHEVILHAEQPVVAKEAVPVERVRLGTETVTEEQEITEQVRKERIDDPDVESGRRGQDR